MQRLWGGVILHDTHRLRDTAHFGHIQKVIKPPMGQITRGQKKTGYKQTIGRMTSPVFGFFVRWIKGLPLKK